MCDMTVPDQNGDVAEGPCSASFVRRGDLLVCTNHAKDIPWNVGRVPGEVRCWCGGFRPPSTPCGEPCDY
jgi:hypothetical protein